MIPPHGIVESIKKPHLEEGSVAQVPYLWWSIRGIAWDTIGCTQLIGSAPQSGQLSSPLH